MNEPTPISIGPPAGESDHVSGARSEAPVRGAALWKRLDALMLRLDRAVESLIPTRFNPFAQTGAIATTAFMVAAITGVALLIWYRPSVHQGYESVLAMEAVWIGSFVRSLHRYSSDICIFFVMIHALRLLFAGRFTGARWLAWVTGVVLIGVLWFVGWTGYLLVWDEPAQLIAQGSAKVLDLVPVFSEPISRAFLADELVPSLLFFVVFFTHMLLPLVMAVGLWLHVGRVQRARVLTSRWMSVWTVGAMVALSVILPATAGAPADAGNNPGAMAIDAWYLFPLVLTDRLSAGMVWALLGIVGGVIVALPWLLRRSETTVAILNETRCNGCTLCARDCPYDAIVMVPRKDDRPYEMQAQIDPLKCVGCGICAGACDSGAIGLDWLPVQATRRRTDDWIDLFIEESDDEAGPVVAFLCSESAAARFPVNPETGQCPQLPGVRVIAVPCAGWVQPLSIERALRRGAAGVLIAGCSHSEPKFREGNKWLEGRIAGTRKPTLRSDKTETWRIKHVTFDRTRADEFVELVAKFRKKVRENTPESLDRITPPGASETPITDTPRSSETPQHRNSATPAVAGIVLTATLAAIVAFGSVMPYPGPPTEEPKLIVSVKHHGQLEEECRPLSEEEQASQPAHMQQTETCERGRADVVIEIEVDGELIEHQAHPPGGISGDGPAVTLDRIDIKPGNRQVTVRIADDNDGNWRFEETRTLEFKPGGRQSVLFDTSEGFRWF